LLVAAAATTAATVTEEFDCASKELPLFVLEPVELMLIELRIEPLLPDGEMVLGFKALSSA
jgi:hypothetical protein